jgi:NitT/TauT family transport system ATP-binding protein
VTSSGSGALRVEHASKSFRDQSGARIEAVRDVSLEIKEGEFVGIVGPSGCGKTTLLNAIAGLIPLDSGRISVDLPSPQGGGGLRKAYLFQRDTTLPWLSVRKNLEICLELSGQKGGGAETDRKVDQVLRASQLEGFAGHYPYQLSGGMRRRLALFQVLITEPDLLMLDEPFASLDEPTRLELHALLLSLPTARIAVIVTHDIAEAITLCDVIVVMTNRPAQIKAVHSINIERPRDVYQVRETDSFAKLYRTIWAELKDEIAPQEGLRRREEIAPASS